MATPYIHALSAKMIEYLYGVANARPTSEVELQLVLEVLKMVETLIAIANEDKRKDFNNSILTLIQCVLFLFL